MIPSISEVLIVSFLREKDKKNGKHDALNAAQFQKSEVARLVSLGAHIFQSYHTEL